MIDALDSGSAYKATPQQRPSPTQTLVHNLAQAVFIKGVEALPLELNGINKVDFKFNGSALVTCICCWRCSSGPTRFYGGTVSMY